MLNLNCFAFDASETLTEKWGCGYHSGLSSEKDDAQLLMTLFNKSELLGNLGVSHRFLHIHDAAEIVEPL